MSSLERQRLLSQLPLRSPRFQRGLVLAAGVVTLVLSLFMFALSVHRPYLGADVAKQGNEYVVTQLDASGMVYGAGVRVGDRVTAIDGRQVEGSSTADVFKGRPVDSLSVVTSDGRFVQVRVAGSVAPWRSAFSPISFMAIGLLFWGIGLFAFSRRRDSASARLLFLLSSVILLALITATAGTRNVPTSLTLQVVAWVLGPALFVLLFLVFPEGGCRRKSFSAWARRATYAWTALVFAFYIAIGHNDSVFYPYFRTFLLLNLTAGLMVGTGELVHTWLSAAEARIKQQTKIVAAGTVVGIVPFLALSTVPDALTGRTLVRPEITILAVLLMPASIAYAIVKHRLMDIDLVIKRGIVYGSMTSMTVVVFFVLLALLGVFWHSLVDFERVGIALGMSAGAAVLFGPVKEKLDVAVGRVFYKDRYDYNKKVKELSSAVAALKNTEDISRFAVFAAVDTLNLDGACLYTRDKPGSFREAAAAGSFDGSDRQSLAGLLPRLTPETEFPNAASPGHPGVSFFVPLVASGGEVGVLCLGAKVTRQQFSVDDTYLLHGFAPAVASALRNAALLREIGARDAQLKVAYENLRESEGQYRALVEAGDQMGVAIVLIQNTDKLEAAHVFANGEWARMTGHSTETLKAKSYFDLIHPLYRDAVAARVRQGLRGREIPGRYEIYIVARDGSETPVEMTVAPVTYRGRPAVVSYLKNITDRKQAEARLREMATRDYLTGLWNHREFQERLPAEVARAQRSEEHFSLLFLDIDHFKAVNDRFGHQMGDQILQMLGRFLKDVLRTSDIACRYGGDEFAVILPNTDVEHSRALVARIQDSFDELRKREVLLNMLELQPGLSIGIAGYPEDASDAQELLRKANQAMFYSKSLGGNRAQIWGEAMKEFEAEPERLRGLLRQANLDTALALAGAIDARDAHTLGHSKRVSELAVAVARRMGLGEAEVEGIRVSGLLHDVGKIGLSDALLHKRTILTEEEFRSMKKHVGLGVKMLGGLDYMKDKLDIIGGHHENWDGTGYPQGLSGNDIALGARIIRVVDSYDAMVTDRPYRRHISQEQALLEIAGLSGKAFDPAVVSALKAVTKPP